MKRFFFIVIFGVLCFSLSFSQEKKITLQPVIFSTPETGLSAGAIGFYKKKSEERYNTIFGFASYSINGQINFLLRPDVFLLANNYRLQAELNYKRRVNKFWGLGNSTAESNEEDVDHQEILMALNFYRTVKHNFFVGLSYNFYTFFDVDTTENALLDALGNLGSKPYIVSGVGPSLLYDTRKNPINPASGWYIGADYKGFIKAIGSDFDFGKYSLDVRFYKKISANKNHILAFQTTAEINTGTIPWNQNAELGGLDLRGYFKGRYRDNNLNTFQIEYRSPLLIWKIGIAGFAGVGMVHNFDEKIEFDNVHPSLGGGLRFQLDNKDRLNLRFDFAVGDQGNNGLYFGIREAF
ncbi:BamA/TamA family outer membrane protein [Aquimarina agarivorans]|uniref:BamA/TamA family outer membrane protein n=1 Tax=Aquimarina agarivorans TaxID=980584 RepID=UPI000248F30B|nr:BamA/TamA family outer membrane protein [Aquimarina agarivorans]